MPDRVADPWGERTPYGPGREWPERVDLHIGEGVDPERVSSWHQSASVLHSTGEAMDIAVADGRLAGIRGRASEGVNRGRLAAEPGVRDQL